jgi:hypothetical protein
MAKKKKADKYTVIRDSREKDGHGWWFSTTDRCHGTSAEYKLETGDYSLDGYEDIFTIERKGCVGEFKTNLCEDRFYRELERLAEFKYAYIILEFEMDDILRYPDSIKGITRKQKQYIKMGGYALLHKFIAMTIKYNIHVLFVGDCGRDVASCIFKQVIEHERKDKPKRKSAAGRS